MKTAVSVPDAIFEQAEVFARRAKRSRSQLFSDALSEYLGRHSGDEITDAMNRVIDATGDAADPSHPLRPNALWHESNGSRSGRSLVGGPALAHGFRAWVSKARSSSCRVII